MVTLVRGRLAYWVIYHPNYNHNLISLKPRNVNNMNNVILIMINYYSD